MAQSIVRIGFIGAGGIARSHAYSLNALKYYYNDIPEIIPEAVCSLNKGSRDLFAQKYGFKKSCNLDDFISNSNIDTVFILGPNSVHFEHFKAALGMKGIKRIYIEKPVCSTSPEESAIKELAKQNPSVKIQIGFQYLFSPAAREAFAFWKTGKPGKPVHFNLNYYHGDYLKKEYREKRANRLTPSPDGGAMADLGSHAISLLIAFLGNDLSITGAIQSGRFDDVSVGSDLFSQISVVEKKSLSAGSITASRISAGTGDELSVEIYAEKGAIRFSSTTPDYFEFYSEESGLWSKMITGSNYKRVTSFPSEHVPPGWLRSMVHAQYVFLTGGKSEIFVPDIDHGLEVQRLLRETAEYLESYRKKFW